VDYNRAAVVQIGQSRENLKSNTISKILQQVLYVAVAQPIEATHMPTKKGASLNEKQSFSWTLFKKQ
jgi:hypothetical protein